MVQSYYRVKLLTGRSRIDPSAATQTCIANPDRYGSRRTRVNCQFVGFSAIFLHENIADFDRIFGISDENLADFDWVFGVSDESGTYNNPESYDSDPKLTLTYIVLLRKVPILKRIGKKYSASSGSAEKNIKRIKS